MTREILRGLSIFGLSISAVAMQSSASANEMASACDAERGKVVFTKCLACHSAQENVHMAGPSLYGVVGRPAGNIEGFRFSRAISNLQIEWTVQNLDAFLTSPQSFARGTIMAFGGLRDAQERADVICYLQSLPEANAD